MKVSYTKRLTQQRRRMSMAKKKVHSRTDPIVHFFGRFFV